MMSLCQLTHIGTFNQEINLITYNSTPCRQRGRMPSVSNREKMKRYVFFHTLHPQRLKNGLNFMKLSGNEIDDENEVCEE